MTQIVWTHKEIETLIFDLLIAQMPTVLGNQMEMTKESMLNGDDTLALDSLGRYQAASFVAQFFNLKSSMDPMKLVDDTDINFWVDTVTHHMNHHADIITFATSGTTGKRKFIEHQLDNLVTEAHFWAQRYAQIKHINRLVPSHHIYGFIWTILLPKLLNIACDDVRRALPDEYLFSSANSLLVAIPNNLKLLNYYASMADDVSVVVSTSPCEHELLKQSYESGYIDVSQIYGSTETGGLGYRNQDNERYTLPDYVRREGDMLKHIHGHKLPVQDHLVFAADNTYKVEGRLDDVIQLNGHNVSISSLSDSIRALTFINDVKIEVMKSDGIASLHAKVACPEVTDYSPLELKENINKSINQKAHIASVTIM